MSGPLSNLRVLELGTLIAAPFAARLLAEFGADAWPAGPAEYQAFMIAEEAKWGPVVRAAGATRG
jgi:crotonobetainyl-CoA:carnitine CoA-transferase CaiB-like acyl-CoA transferase